MDTYKVNCFANLYIILCNSEFIMKINIHVIIILIYNDEEKPKNTMALISNNNK